MNSRGQSMVIFAMTLLLLTLMVLMTVGLGVHIHERQEEQITADAAAYSESVFVARSYNTISALNRTMVAQMASVAAAQSLISWAGFYHGTLNQARDALMDKTLVLPSQCDQTLLQARANIMAEDYRLITVWEWPNYHGIDHRDPDAAHYIRGDLYQTALDIADDEYKVWTDLKGRMKSGQIALNVAKEARKASPWASDPKELQAAPNQPVTQAEDFFVVNETQRDPTDMVRATMGTRGVQQFLSSREASKDTYDLSAADYVAMRLTKITPPLVATVTDFGTSYFADKGPWELSGWDGEPVDRKGNWQAWSRVNKAGLQYTFSFAQDVGIFAFKWPNAPAGCALNPPKDDSFGYVRVSGPNDDTDNHMWRRGDPTSGDYRERFDELGRVPDPPTVRHSFLKVPPRATDQLAIWPVFVDFDSNAAMTGAGADTNLWGQPKSTVLIVRDYASRNPVDPWDFKLKFDFTKGSGGELLNLKDSRAGVPSKSMAIASGLAYYHRGAIDPSDKVGHSREPPNFLNPFWRATLVASDVDETSPKRGDGIIQTLNANGMTTQATAFKKMRAAGFRGIP